MLVTFPDAHRYQFGAAFVAPPANPLKGVVLYPDKLAIELEQTTLARLLQRVADDIPVILPYATIQEGQRRWLIAAATRRDLDRMGGIAARFLIPTYAEFANSARVPERKVFQSEGAPLQQIGAVVYPAGSRSGRLAQRCSIDA